jgi:chorismate synthase
VLRWLTAGESHGPALSAIIEGMPAHVLITSKDIDIDLSRRRLGFGRGGDALYRITFSSFSHDDGG